MSDGRVELHTHLEGAVTPARLIALSERHGQPDRCDVIDGKSNTCCRRDVCGISNLLDIGLDRDGEREKCMVNQIKRCGQPR